jgi:hypothetical protein
LILIELRTQEFPHGITELESITKEVMNLVQKLKRKVVEEDDMKKGIFSPVDNHLNVDKVRFEKEQIIKTNLEKQYEFDKNWILNVIEEKETFSQDILLEVFEITKNILNDYYGYYLELPEIPKFLPGPKGSIDVFWKTKNNQFIFNYNPLNRQNIEYFGKDKEGNEIRGFVKHPKRLMELLGWTQN